MTQPIFKKILAFLEEQGVEFQLLEHEHVHTSADAAKTRGTKLEEAAKALVLEAKFDEAKRLFMCVVSGHRKLNLNMIKTLLGCKNVSLAHPDDVFNATKCKIGTVSPFPALYDLEGFVDADVLNREYVVFSVASHNHSVRMKSQDWVRIAGVKIADIGKEV